ncbi:transglutaminase domain-containing protein [Streptomyces sp. NPDC020917]|uniref:transglutaminase domain-containing protein n=1 Tax=Streptomyces sp. NPDC020917 TaxID=3365102 RepID=UPI0037A06010
MTSSLLMPRRRVGTRTTRSGAAAGGTAPTPILDWRHPAVAAFVGRIDAAPGAQAAPHADHRIAQLHRAHRVIAAYVRPVYSVQDERPVSEVLRRRRGSCSQRLAVLECVARASGVATRVRGLLVDGRFWYPRFPRLRFVVPRHVVLAWPEFRVDGPSPDGGGTAAWLTASELFADLHESGAGSAGGFTNAGAETLFEAVSRTAVDWDGVTVCPAAGPGCDLSAYVVADLGHHDSRDALFDRHGQSLCGTARLIAEPVLGRRAAGAQGAAAL